MAAIATVVGSFVKSSVSYTASVSNQHASTITSVCLTAIAARAAYYQNTEFARLIILPIFVIGMYKITPYWIKEPRSDIRGVVLATATHALGILILHYGKKLLVNDPSKSLKNVLDACDKAWMATESVQYDMKQEKRDSDAASIIAANDLEKHRQDHFKAITKVAEAETKRQKAISEFIAALTTISGFESHTTRIARLLEGKNVIEASIQPIKSIIEEFRMLLTQNEQTQTILNGEITTTEKNIKDLYDEINSVKKKLFELNNHEWSSKCTEFWNGEIAKTNKEIERLSGKIESSEKAKKTSQDAWEKENQKFRESVCKLVHLVQLLNAECWSDEGDTLLIQKLIDYFNYNCQHVAGVVLPEFPPVPDIQKILKTVRKEIGLVIEQEKKKLEGIYFAILYQEREIGEGLAIIQQTKKQQINVESRQATPEQLNTYLASFQDKTRSAKKLCVKNYKGEPPKKFSEETVALLPKLTNTFRSLADANNDDKKIEEIVKKEGIALIIGEKTENINDYTNNLIMRLNLLQSVIQQGNSKVTPGLLFSPSMFIEQEKTCTALDSTIQDLGELPVVPFLKKLLYHIRAKMVFEMTLTLIKNASDSRIKFTEAIAAEHKAKTDLEFQNNLLKQQEAERSNLVKPKNDIDKQSIKLDTEKLELESKIKTAQQKLLEHLVKKQTSSTDLDELQRRLNQIIISYDTLFLKKVLPADAVYQEAKRVADGSDPAKKETEQHRKSKDDGTVSGEETILERRNSRRKSYEDASLKKETKIKDDHIARIKQLQAQFFSQSLSNSTERSKYYGRKKSEPNKNHPQLPHLKLESEILCTKMELAETRRAKILFKMQTDLKVEEDQKDPVTLAVEARAKEKQEQLIYNYRLIVQENSLIQRSLILLRSIEPIGGLKRDDPKIGNVKTSLEKEITLLWAELTALYPLLQHEMSKGLALRLCDNFKFKFEDICTKRLEDCKDLIGMIEKSMKEGFWEKRVMGAHEALEQWKRTAALLTQRSYNEDSLIIFDLESRIFALQLKRLEAMKKWKHSTEVSWTEDPESKEQRKIILILLDEETRLIGKYYAHKVIRARRKLSDESKFNEKALEYQMKAFQARIDLILTKIVITLQHRTQKNQDEDANQLFMKYALEEYSFHEIRDLGDLLGLFFKERPKFLLTELMKENDIDHLLSLTEDIKSSISPICTNSSILNGKFKLIKRMILKPFLNKDTELKFHEDIITYRDEKYSIKKSIADKQKLISENYGRDHTFINDGWVDNSTTKIMTMFKAYVVPYSPILVSVGIHLFALHRMIPEMNGFLTTTNSRVICGVMSVAYLALFGNLKEEPAPEKRWVF